MTMYLALLPFLISKMVELDRIFGASSDHFGVHVKCASDDKLGSATDSLTLTKSEKM